MDDLPVIHLCLFGCGLVVNSAPTRQSDLGPHTPRALNSRTPHTAGARRGRGTASLGHTASFSVKLRSLVETDKPDLTASDPFPYVWNGKGMARRDPLRSFPVSDLLVGSTLAVETQISSYTFASSAPIRTGYTMSLRAVFFLEDPDPARPSAFSTPRRKRPGDELVSPRRNKVAGQRAVFSDDDDD